ncbi:MAG TPA: FkbM family methyltransferase [Pyrinomonadaceae bacterium]|nr:FkbM family methyltransferase [Pyrinomonadaceae bacterium]
MNIEERIAFAIRHNRHLGNAQWLWNYVRPIYDRLSGFTGRKGLPRNINGTDKILVAPRWRMISEEYEPEVWRALLGEVRPGDVIADVGSYVGLYAVALAKRVGATGRVIAFEPESSNHQALKEHIELNKVVDRVTLVRAAVGDRRGFVEMSSNLDSSHVSGSVVTATDSASAAVPCVTLDEFFADQKLDLLKIDVEGFEEKVLQGAASLLTDAARSPRVIFIEVHPYAWPDVGTTSESFLQRLGQFGYRVQELSGERTQRIENYGEVLAYKVA